MKPILKTRRVALESVRADEDGTPVEIEVRQMSAADFEGIRAAGEDQTTLERAAAMAMVSVTDWGAMGEPDNADQILECLPPGVLIEISDQILELNGAAAEKNLEPTAGEDSS